MQLLTKLSVFGVMLIATCANAQDIDTLYKSYVQSEMTLSNRSIAELLDDDFLVVSQGMGSIGPSFTLQSGSKVFFCQVILPESRHPFSGQRLHPGSVCHRLN